MFFRYIMHSLGRILCPQNIILCSACILCPQANFRELSCGQYEMSVFDRKRTFMIIKLRKSFGPFLPNRGDPYHKKKSKFSPVRVRFNPGTMTPRKKFKININFWYLKSLKKRPIQKLKKICKTLQFSI